MGGEEMRLRQVRRAEAQGAHRTAVAGFVMTTLLGIALVLAVALLVVLSEVDASGSVSAVDDDVAADR